MYNDRQVLAAIAVAIVATAAGAQTTHMVDVGPGIVFTSDELSIDVGDTVRWTWIDGFHNVESGVDSNHDGNFRSGDPTDVDGTTFEVTFDPAYLDAHPMPGDVYPYYCIVHVGFGMTGTVTVAVPVAGDGDDDGDVDLVDYQQFFTCVSGPGAPFDANGAATHDVSVGPGFSFSPAELGIEIGDTVHWTWIDGFHNVESGVDSDHDGNFRSGDPTDVDGTTYDVTFDQAFLDANPMPGNAYPYFCVIHVGFGMEGTITTQPNECAAFDLDGDGDVDLVDFGQFQAAFTGQ